MYLSNSGNNHTLNMLTIPLNCLIIIQMMQKLVKVSNKTCEVKIMSLI